MNYKTSLYIICVCAMLTGFSLLTSCSRDESDTQRAHKQPLRLQLQMQRADYGTTRADVQWQQGDRVYLQFTVGTARVAIWADYDAAEDDWKLDATSSARLTAQTDPACEAFYFVDPDNQTTQRVTLGAQTVVLADEVAACDWNEDEGTITVKGTLSPLTARLRLVGEPGRTFALSGLTRYTAYNAAANSFTASTATVTGTIGDNGSSDFLHVLLTDEASRQLTLAAEGVAAYVRTFTAAEFQRGQSGWLTLPTTQAMGRWQMVNTGNGQEITLPTLSAATTNAVGSRTAALAATVTANGNGTILDAGFLVSEAEGMTAYKTFSCGRKTDLATAVSGLKAVTTYYVRAYARNERGSATGPLLTFNTTEEGTVDITDFPEADENWEDAQTSQGDITLDDFGVDETWEDAQTSQGDITQDDFPADEDWN